MKWEDAINSLVLILENPQAEKGYRELRKYYASCGRQHEADAIQYLIDKRFGNADSSASNQEQPGNN